MTLAHSANTEAFITNAKKKRDMAHLRVIQHHIIQKSQRSRHSKVEEEGWQRKKGRWTTVRRCAKPTRTISLTPLAFPSCSLDPLVDPHTPTVWLIRINLQSIQYTVQSISASSDSQSIGFSFLTNFQELQSTEYRVFTE